MIQSEYFKKASTDELLSLRFKFSCFYPIFENQIPDFTNDGNMWYIDKNCLYEELAKRPHRVRAKHRRKTYKNHKNNDKRRKTLKAAANCGREWLER